jgi:hypothetical protein
LFFANLTHFIVPCIIFSLSIIFKAFSCNSNRAKLHPKEDYGTY